MVWHSTLHMRLSRVYISNEFHVNSMSDDHEHCMHESWRGTAHRTWASYVYESHAVCCCVLQWVAVCCSVLQSHGLVMCMSLMLCVAVCCSVLQLVAVCCHHMG